MNNIVETEKHVGVTQNSPCTFLAFWKHAPCFTICEKVYPPGSSGPILWGTLRKNAMAVLSRLLYPSVVGSRDSSVVQHRTLDRNVVGSSLRRCGGKILFSGVTFLCWLLFRYLFQARVIVVALKNPDHFAKSTIGRLRLITDEPCVRGFEWSDTVNWCMVLWRPQNVGRDGSSFTWHQPCNNQTAL